MPVYMLYGFRWPRAGFTGIRVYIVLHNLEDATAEYLQQPLTSELVMESLKKTEPSIISRLPNLRFIEQYDPEDTSDDAVSKPYAYVGGKVISIPEDVGPTPETSWKPEDIFKEEPLEKDAMEALTEFRDKYAAGERIGWWIVYNGDPERWFPHDEEEDADSFDDGYDEEGSYADGGEYESDQTQTPPETPSSATMRFPERLTRLFARRTA
ncbi:AorFlbE [Aspergillus vadensis CBS 113365]|uniref:AorFlbE n=1 Tax=Aspergillus vadensis (strain CBS 113365 / IMI 142717 / IBT 24658) TaxID=1448311 RepID=A0A319BLX1_ASPVC|nr:AorFlbE [Aspergillus vadensis CBS 113365]PYH64258.1 AorFlbE [Aspergillus vadensis CBS 113365]